MPDDHPDFTLRLPSVDALFFEFDARPVAQRPMRDEVHEHLLDQWERVRATPPPALTLILPASERGVTDEDAVRAAIHTDLRASCGPLRRAGPLSRQDRVTLTMGLAALIVCIALATALERLTGDFVVAGIAQGITLIGWVAMWAPADHFFKAIVPHTLNRRRYAEFADLDVRFRWV